MPFAGETLPLSNQLHDGDTTKFVRAILLDETGTPLGASPVSLPHIGNGKYSSDAVTMPSGVDYIDVTYETFDDAGFTVLSPDHTLSTDVFRLEVPDTVLVAKLDAIKAVVDQILGNIVGFGSRLLSRIMPSKLESEVQDDNIKSDLKSSDISSTVQDIELKSKLEDSDIDSKVKC